MKRWTGPVAAGLVLVAAFAGGWWLLDGGAAARSGAAPLAAAPAVAAPPVEGDGVGAAATAATAAAAAPAAPSWSGTEVDGDIHLDARGNVVPDRALRDLFDYLLTARGELTLEQIRTRLAAVGRTQALTPSQATQLAGLFGRYLDYLAALPQTALAGDDAEAYRRTYEARRALRRGVLGVEMAEGFFAEDEARDRYEVARIAIRDDRSLTTAQRAQALDDLARTAAPPALREVVRRSAQVSDLATETERLRAAGADAAAIQALREREVGSEAAQRLAELDAQRAQWQQRVEGFRATRDRLLADARYAPEDRRQQVETLIARDFSEEEAIRLRAQTGGAEPAATR